MVIITCVAAFNSNVTNPVVRLGYTLTFNLAELICWTPKQSFIETVTFAEFTQTYSFVPLTAQIFVFIDVLAVVTLVFKTYVVSTHETILYYSVK